MSARADRDDFENASLSVIRTLCVLAAAPEEACELQGHYNVAQETKQELDGALSIFQLRACTLTEENRVAIAELVDAVKAVPPEILAFTQFKEESLDRMKHSSWYTPREKARAIVKALESATATNTWYFEQDRSNWREPCP